MTQHFIEPAANYLLVEIMRRDDILRPPNIWLCDQRFCRVLAVGRGVAVAVGDVVVCAQPSLRQVYFGRTNEAKVISALLAVSDVLGFADEADPALVRAEPKPPPPRDLDAETMNDWYEGGGSPVAAAQSV